MHTAPPTNPLHPMASIKINHPHTRSQTQALQAIEHIADALALRYGVQHTWEGQTLALTGHGIQACIENCPGQVQVRAELSLLVSAFKGAIEQEVRRVLAENFD